MPRKTQSLEGEGERLYQSRLRGLLEKEHHGKYVAIEVESGEYFVGETLGEALAAAEQRHPNKRFYVVRVGHPAAVTFKHRAP